MSIKDNNIIEKSVYKDGCCNAFGCINRSTETIDVSAGKYGIISLKVCSICIKKFQ
jgi:hypothetical protein